ncbi:MAG: VPLPA-CTERM sorting domain-containing protein [Syntrophotaleaceae bacterium]
MQRLLLSLLTGCILSAFPALSHAYLVPLSTSSLYGTLPEEMAFARAEVSSAVNGVVTVTVSSNPLFQGWGAVFDEIYLNLNPAGDFENLRIEIDPSMGGDWQLIENAQTGVFGSFSHLLSGTGLGNRIGQELICRLMDTNLQVDDLLWNNENGWSLAVGVQNPQIRTSDLLAASVPVATPLPSALLMLASGIGGIGVFRRRSERK